jgi:hypothetical protein
MSTDLGLSFASVPAAASLVTKQHYAMLISTSADTCNLQSSAGGEVSGVLDNEPAAGQQAKLTVFGPARAILGGVVTKGDELSVDSSGKFVLASDSSHKRVARALETGTTNDIRDVFIYGRISEIDRANANIAKIIAHAQVTADTTFFKGILSLTRSFIIASVGYYNETGLAGSTGNSWSLALQNAAVGVAASWSTETGGEGTITADTCVELTNGSLTNRTVAAGAFIKLYGDLTGSKTLPAGFFVIRGYLV